MLHTWGEQHKRDAALKTQPAALLLRHACAAGHTALQELPQLTCRWAPVNRGAPGLREATLLQHCDTKRLTKP
jgi:hypothetical protein